MEPIRVPAPPKEAFNKHRRVSDLIRKQVHHLKHLEQKLPEHLRAELPQHHVVTEEDAARYIGPMTQLLLSSKQATPALVAKPKQPAKPKSRGLTLAAAEEPKRESSAPKSKPAKKAAARPRKGKKA
jgi:hypothetical protein